jgi:hypothetical protein
MSEIPKELIPIIVMLWMNLHTAKRRGLLNDGHVEFRSDVDCGVTVFINNSGLVNFSWHKSDHQKTVYVWELMPAGPDSVGIADLEVRR